MLEHDTLRSRLVSMFEDERGFDLGSEHLANRVLKVLREWQNRDWE